MILIPIALVLIAFVAYDLARPRHRLDVETSSGPVARGVVLALGRVEGWKLARHPILLAGAGLTGLVIWVAGTGSVASMARDDHVIPFFLFPFAGLTIVAVGSAVLRGRRDGVEELYASLPASRESRTGAHLLAVAWAVAWSAVLVGALLGYLYAVGGFGTPHPGELLTVLVLVACAGAVGVTATRLVPSVAATVVAVVLMGVLQGLTAHFSGSTTTRTAWFAPWVEDGEFFGPGLWVRRPWSHLVYLIGLGMFAAVLGFLRHRVDRRTIASLLASLIVIAAGGLAQSRPFTDGDYERMVALVERGATLCDARSDVRYCVFEGNGPLIEHWRPAVEGVLARVPARVAARPLVVSQRIPAGALHYVPPALKARFHPDTPSSPPDVWQPDGGVHPGPAWCGGSCALALAAQAGAWAVGLPLDPRGVHPDPYDVYDASGEARAVVALWLGASATPETRATFPRRVRFDPTVEEGARPGEPVLMTGCEGVTETGTEFGMADVLLARALLGLPDDHVTRVLHANWDRLVDPRTSSSALADLFDVHVDPGEAARAFFVSC